jgi:hypothetical protein
VTGGFVVFNAIGNPEYADYASWRFRGQISDISGIYNSGSWFRGQIEDAISLWTANPILGCGFEQAAFHVTHGHEIHNGFLAILAETGLVGLLLFFLPIAVIIRSVFRVYVLSRGTPWEDFVERITLPFLPWIVFSIHNRLWRDRAFWVTIIVVMGVEGILRARSRNDRPLREGKNSVASYEVGPIPAL